MTTRTQRTIAVGVNPSNASDVSTWTLSGANDEIEAVHKDFPTDGKLVSTQIGTRLHLLGFADTEEGAEGTPEIPAVSSTGATLPDIWGQLGAADFTFADEATFTVTARTTPSTPQFFAFYLSIGTGPSGLIWETGDSTDGAYVGFVDGKLVVRNGTGADLRVDASILEGLTGTLFVEFNPTAGTVQAWFGEQSTAQAFYLGTSTGDAGNWHGAAGSGAYHRAANGTANIEAGTGTAPTTGDSATTNTYSSSFAANMPTHAVGDMLIACVSLHPYGGDNLVDASVSGWTRILDHDGASGSYAPTAQIFTKLATKTNETCQVSVSGATRNWEKTVTVMTINNAKQVTATLGDVQNGSNTTIDFPAAVGSPGLVLHCHIGSVKTALTVPGSDTLVSSNGYYPRTQLWSETTATASILNHSITTYPAHTSLTLNVFGDTAGEGAVAPANVTVSAVTGPSKGPNADTWVNSLAPTNILDVGYEGDGGTPLIPAGDPVPYEPGSQDVVFSEKTAGSYLETIAARLVQTRTGAGLWNARLFAITDGGEFVYGAPLRAPFDVTTTGIRSDRTLQKQPKLNSGKSLDDAVNEGWAFGLVLETVTEDPDSPFGSAELHVAQLVAEWVVPPIATILFPVAGTTLATVAPQVGWSIPSTETQLSYRVRVWEAASYDSNNPDGGRIAFDSGLVFSQSTRAAQVTRPLRPEVGYVFGVLLQGEAINGLPVTAPWVTVEVSTPAPLIDIGTQGQDTVTATPKPDGCVEITAATFTDDLGDWAMVERARVADLDAAATADVDAESYVALETVWRTAMGWEAPIAAGEIAATGGNGQIMVEVRGTWPEMSGPTSTNLFDYQYLTFLGGGLSLQFTNDGGIQLVLRDETTVRFSAIPAVDLAAAWTFGNEIWIRVRWIIDTAHTGANVFWEITDDGETWTQIYQTTRALGLVTGPDTLTASGSVTIGSYAFASSTSQASGTSGVFRSGKIVNTNNGGIERVLVDVDIDRDTGGDETVTTFTDATGFVWTDLGGDGISGTELVRVGADPAYESSRIGVPGGTYSVAEDVGISTTGLPVRVTGADYTQMGVEWFGTIRHDGLSVTFPLVEITDGASVKLELSISTDRLLLRYYSAAAASFFWAGGNGSFDAYWGRRVGIRITWDNADGSAFVYLSLDEGRSWFLHWYEATASGTTPLTINPILVTDTIYLAGSYADTRKSGVICEAFRLWSLGDQEMIVDVDLGRDITDISSPTFVDRLGMTWTKGTNVEFIERGARRNIPNAQADDLWVPVVGLRELVIGGVSSAGGPRVRFTDPAPPQHEDVAYRVRLIDEPAPTFEATSTDWVETAPVRVDTSTWWISNLSGTSRFAVEPESAGWTNARPGEASSGVGRSDYVVVSDVLKSRILPVSIVTDTQTDLDLLRSLIDPGDPIFLTDVHGHASIVKPGSISTLLIPAARWGSETAPVGRVYQTSVDLTEVRDPRDFGFGTNLTIGL